MILGKENYQQMFVRLRLPCEYYNPVLLEVINMQIPPMISTHYPAIKGWDTQNYQVGRIYLELTPNSHNLVTRKSVAARGEN